MQSSGEWLAATRIDTRRLILEPLQVAHVDEMVFVLGDEALYKYAGGAAPTLEDLRGYATEAAAAMVAWLGRHNVMVVAAHIDPSHAASMTVAMRLGLTATFTVIDGETRWTRQRP